MLAQLLHLPGALEQEIELRLERRRARIAVEALEERVVLALLEHEVAAEARGEPAREARLADADRALHDHEPVRRLDDLDVVLRPAGAGLMPPSSTVRPYRCGPASVRTRPTPGTSRSGAISASGASTNARSAMPGCGTLSLRFVDARGAVHQQVEVDAARAPAHDRALATEALPRGP